MPIKIHHGPPGSYKTSGALGDDFIREARAGRTVVTNVRGMSRERVLEHHDDIPATFDLIWIDDRTEEGRYKLCHWFHWAPEGAYLFIDEAQDIWPRHWRDSDLAALNYPGGREKALEDNRPADWAMAWDKHRHWNWDLVLTTPHIKKIRDDIKDVADAAYKHKNLALLGFGGRYIEGFHSPGDAGTNDSHFYSINHKKVPKYVWKLYDSTATGQISDTKSGLSILKNPRILILVGVLGLAAYFALRGGGTVLSPQPVLQASTPTAAANPAPSGKAAPVHSPARTDSTGAVIAHGKVSGDLPNLAIPFIDADPVIMGTSKWRGKTRYYIDLGDAMVTSDDYLKAGYTMTEYGPCAAKFSHQGFTQIVRCAREPSPRGNPAEKRDLARSAAPGADEEPRRRGEAVAAAPAPVPPQGNDSTNPRFNVALRGQ